MKTIAQRSLVDWVECSFHVEKNHNCRATVGSAFQVTGEAWKSDQNNLDLGEMGPAIRGCYYCESKSDSAPLSKQKLWKPLALN